MGAEAAVIASFSLEERLLGHPALREIYERVSRIPPVDAGHAFDHTVRVAKLCGHLYLDECSLNERAPTDLELDSAIAAGLLHDCVPVAKDSPLRKQSAELCAREAELWLQEFSWPSAEMVRSIVDAVEDHSYSSGRVPRSPIGQVLQDADRLEALGAIGLYRTIATGIAMGTALFDVMDPWARDRPLDDKRFTIDHFYTKLLKLPETFRTNAARIEAERRAEFLRSFAAQLKSELL
jgi:uncharacterized protein